MNKKQKIVIVVLLIFTLGMIIGAADAASHSVKKGKYKVKLTTKEYKKLTATKTKYKTVNKTKTVTKYKTVKKTRTVTKENVTIKERVKINTTYYSNYPEPMRAVNKTEEVINLENEGYVRTGDVWTEKYSPPMHIDKELGYGEETGYVWFTQKASDDFQNFTKTTYYTAEEEYTEDEPYTVTEKYQVKVPYKVRKDATVTKKVPKKFKTVKEAYYVWKKVKSYYTVSEWKYVGKSEILGLQTPAMKKDTQRRVKKIRAAGWKINKDEHRSKYDLVDGGVYRHYYLCTKKVYYTEKKKVKKYKKVKKQVKMRIKSWAQDACPKGKVWVTLYYGDQLKKGKCISQGYAKIK